ncbi:MAG: hypothetical protein MZU95_07220 [Desulfomicrobium escambiense]|nr:hypothetical protein [Desulfomicrobium escambiense]
MTVSLIEAGPPCWCRPLVAGGSSWRSYPRRQDLPARRHREVPGTDESPVGRVGRSAPGV